MPHDFEDGIRIVDESASADREIRNNNGLLSIFDENQKETSVISPNRNSIFVTQVSHGFTVGQTVRRNGSTWVLGNHTVSNSPDGIVGRVVDVDTFEVVTGGLVEGLVGLAAGSTYYVSGIGAFSTTEPRRLISGSGGSAPPRRRVSRPILKAISSTAGVVLDQRPISVDGHYYGADRFTNVRTTIAATTGSTPVTYLRNPQVGTADTNVGSLYKVEWNVQYSITNTTEPIRIFVDLNDIGSGGGSYLNSGSLGPFTQTIGVAYPTGVAAYTGFAFFSGTGADYVEIDFSAPLASGGAVGLDRAFLNVIRVTG